MAFFDDYFEPQQYQGGRGLTDLLESLQQQQAYQPGGFAGWPQPGSTVNPTMERAFARQPASAPAAPEMSVSQPTAYPVGNVPLPTPRPGDIPSGGIAIGDYFMPQFGGAQASQYAQAQPDLGDRLSSGFRSWAYTPVGNPFAALANAITGFTTGQFTAAPTLKLPEDDTTAPAVSPAIRAQPLVRTLARRGPARWR
jgi:hypothetical protein